MASILVVYDPKDRLRLAPNEADAERHLGIRFARMSIAEDLDGVDIYDIAEAVCKILLENIQAEGI
jgi:hypothetical protein